MKAGEGMKELEKERKHLKELKNWIRNEAEKFEKDRKELEDKVSDLTKKAGGTFSNDLELAYNQLQFKEKRQKKYMESAEKPYFGRIDFRERNLPDEESFYIGKNSVTDYENSEEFVVDWRAPIADLYYSMTVGRAEFKTARGIIEGDLSLKRRFTFDKETGDIDRIFDEDSQIIVANNGEGQALTDEFLQINLDQSSSSKLKDIVATIAREQNKIIRAEKNIPIIVQGSAGAGKTTVALHRLAFLLYKHRDSLKAENFCIIAPNTIFLDYISEVLPELGSDGIVQTTLEDIIRKHLKITKFYSNKDQILRAILEDEENAKIKARVSKLKGSLNFLNLINEILMELGKEDFENIEIENIALFSSEELKRLFEVDLTYLSFSERKNEMERYCISNLKNRTEDLSLKIEKKYEKKVAAFKNIISDGRELREKLTELYDKRDAVLKNINKTAKETVKAYFKNLKKYDVIEIYSRYLNDRDFIKGFFKEETDEIIDTLSSFNRDEITSDDLTPLMFLSIKINGFKERFSHIVVDEAQDYSLLQLELIRNMTMNDSLTLVGDLSQGIYRYRALKSWEEVNKLFDNSSEYYVLRTSYRSTVEIIEEANKLIDKMNNPVEEAIPVLRHGRVVERFEYSNDSNLLEEIFKIKHLVEDDGRNSIAVITKTGGRAKEVHKILSKKDKNIALLKEDEKKSQLKFVVAPSYMAKGLEFDCVILVDEEDFNDEDLDMSLKYVAMTRALHMEYILNKTR